MMAVDSKQGGTSVPATGTPSAGTPSAAATLAGMPPLSANGQAQVKNKRKRPSSLMAQASELPSVENSLDDFIARANETLGDSSAFDAARSAEKQIKEEDERRRETDALRWKATEQQMRESQAREEALRRQLDGLQGKLAEAEARAAVASAGGSQDGIIADLKVRLTAADDRLRSAEERIRAAEDKARAAEEKAGQLAQDLVAAKAAAAAAPAASLPISFDGEDLEQRVRIAETKAAKAIAAAKAASMGLTVNPADIAAIESGLVVPMDSGKKGTNWGLVFAALVVGAAVAFAAAFVVLKKDKEAPAAAAGVAPAVQPAAPQAAPPAPPPAPAQPIVTPIEEPAPAEAAAAAPAVEEPVVEAVPPVDPPKAGAKAAAAPAKKAPVKKAAPAKKATSGGGLADPFGGDAPAKKKTDKKPAGGGIVDPF
jgi:hypothetical protein